MARHRHKIRQKHRIFPRRCTNQMHLSLGKYLVTTLSRNVMMTRINIPSSGKINIYNTHLCVKCTADELSAQQDVLLPFIDEVETFFPRDNPVILGGDFNIDRFRVDPFEERPFYDRVIDAGLLMLML